MYDFVRKKGPECLVEISGGVQQSIEAEYATAMSERTRRFAELKERCMNDGRFSRLLCLNLVAAGFPADEATKISPQFAIFSAMGLGRTK
ncbi:hypothetical protein [Mesorhizobium ventifaucium]|uniref:Uncharacterized protein n=1 Tax=Mesorhizobium ventifaucium TaxID=666020 RepID=A0ABN8K4U7_9HYPH|nr:hypothetical protein [Mesorhizobium ventifaucium]CAH2405287.1 hypothetical protein MES4922_40166 [Mesorhizobium ventifaucium]